MAAEGEPIQSQSDGAGEIGSGERRRLRRERQLLQRYGCGSRWVVLARKNCTVLGTVTLLGASCDIGCVSVFKD